MDGSLGVWFCIGLFLLIIGSCMFYTQKIEPILKRNQKVDQMFQKIDTQTKKDFEKFKQMLLNGNEVEIPDQDYLCVIDSENEDKFYIKSIKTKKVFYHLELTLENYKDFILDD